jgi:hypothetical protein
MQGLKELFGGWPESRAKRESETQTQSLLFSNSINTFVAELCWRNNAIRKSLESTTATVAALEDELRFHTPRDIDEKLSERG